MENTNEMTLEMDSRSCNEGLARITVAAFATQLNPTLEEVADMEPMFTTKPEQDRSGMGFAFMEAFMDMLEVESEPGKGTVVRMKKKIGTGSQVFE